MESISKPSIVRIARKAGVKSLSEDSIGVIRTIILGITNNIISTSLVVNSENKTKTLMGEDIYNALSILGENIAHSNDLGTNTCI
jgi:histone H3/H4